MQLKQPKSIRQQLTIATSSLLVAAPLQSLAANSSDNSDFENILLESSQLYYAEQERVNVFKSQVLVTGSITDESILTANFVFDTMSGSSPNGRIYSGNVTTSGGNSNTVAVTTASGFSFNANSNQAGADKSWLTAFDDIRTAYGLEWETELTQFTKAVLTGNVSIENDYDSYGTSGTFLWDFNQRRSTLSMAVGFSDDTIRPDAGIPEGLEEVWCGSTAIALDWLSSCEATSPFFYPDPADKKVVDYLVGLTQVWNRSTIFQANYSMGVESGYLTDPYKQVSVVDPSQGNKEIAILYEKRPESRITQSIFFKAMNVVSDSVAAHMSYRFFWDDWDVNAHTVDGKIRFDVSSRSYFQPHVRVSFQSAAFFSQAYIESDTKTDNPFADKPDYISADHRLSEQGTITAGIKYGRTLGKDGKFGIRVEQMHQKYKANLLPDMKVWIVQALLSVRF